jgi:hypothetical protein
MRRYNSETNRDYDYYIGMNKAFKVNIVDVFM